MFEPTHHAAVRYIERFEGNITIAMAIQRLRKIVRQAHFKRVARANARVYVTHGMIFVVKNNKILTVYRQSEWYGTIEA